MTGILLWESLLVLIINIPFGYWRIHVKKFGWQWILAIHLPVGIVVALRLFTSIGFAWQTYIFMVAAFFTGQKLGSLIHNQLARTRCSVTSCLIMDIYRCYLV